MYSNTAAFASSRVRKRTWWTCSVLSEAKKLSMGALSRQLPRRLMDWVMPCRSSTARYGSEAYWVDSGGRRNTPREGVAMGTRKRRSDRALRAVTRSPGWPGVARREDRRRFWASIAAGLSSEEAGGDAGGASVGGRRGFREAGGMAPTTL